MRTLAAFMLLLIVARAACQENASAFGSRQLAQVLDDRPDMKGILPPNDRICKWVTSKFNYGDFGERVHWDHRIPFSGQYAEHCSSFRSHPAQVRVTDARTVTGRDKWHGLVFEFFNLQNSKQFSELTDLARSDGITRDDFGRSCVQLEFRAMMRTKWFFEREPIPGADAVNAPAYTAFLAMKDDFNAYLDWLDTRDREEYDPRRYFGNWFDKYQHAKREYVQRYMFAE